MSKNVEFMWPTNTHSLFRSLLLLIQFNLNRDGSKLINVHRCLSAAFPRIRRCIQRSMMIIVIIGVSDSCSSMSAIRSQLPLASYVYPSLSLLCPIQIPDRQRTGYWLREEVTAQCTCTTLVYYAAFRIPIPFNKPKPPWRLWFPLHRFSSSRKQGAVKNRLFLLGLLVQQ